MGMDFSAFLKYDPSSHLTRDGIKTLITRSLTSVTAVGTMLDYKGHSRLNLLEPVWTDLEMRSVEPPIIPTLTACLWLPEEFCFTFGNDTIYIYHRLRWFFFLTDAEWQRVMLAAVEDFARIFAASDGIVTSDWSPIVGAFFRGESYDSALNEAKGRDGEVARLSDLYTLLAPDGTWDSHGYWRLRELDLRSGAGCPRSDGH